MPKLNPAASVNNLKTKDTTSRLIGKLVPRGLNPSVYTGLDPVLDEIGNHKVKVAALILSSLIAAFSEGITMAALGIAVSVFTSDQLLFIDSLPPTLRGAVQAQLNNLNDGELFTLFVALAVISQIFKTGLLLLSEWSQISIGYVLRIALQKALTKAAMSMEYANIISYPSGTLERTIDQSKLVLDISTQFGSIVRATLMGMTYAALLFTLSFYLAAGALVFVGILWIALSALVLRVRRLADQAASNELRVGRWTIEFLTVPRLIRAFDVADHAGKIINQSWRSYLLPERRIDFVNASVPKILEFVVVISAAGVLAATFLLNPSDPGKLLATLFVFVLVFLRLRPVLKAFSDLRLKWTRIVPRLEIVGKFLQESESESWQSGIIQPTLQQSLRFCNVSFTYPGNSQPTLKDLSFELIAGQKLAIVGASGSGKSTIVSLILGLYRADGEISIDGNELSSLDMSKWRQMIGVVDQDVSLLNTTIANNIKFGREDASVEEVISASKRAHAHQFIEQLEMGYETNAGDRSIKLSGGQKQRIALARALLRNPSLLILDEATSALDTETEKLVQSTFSRLGRETSQIVIAHRLSTVLNADQVLVMGEGGILESGAPEDLLARSSSEFSRLWRTQLS